VRTVSINCIDTGQDPIYDLTHLCDPQNPKETIQWVINRSINLIYKNKFPMICLR
jgi:hypothetical protein